MQLTLSRFARALALLSFFVLALSAPSLAQAPSAPAPEAAAPAEVVGVPRAPVIVNGREVFEVSGETEAEATRRADVINRRLQRLIERDEAVEEFKQSDVLTQDGAPLITLGGEPILNVTGADVAETLVPAPELAQLWGGQLSNNVAAARLAKRGPVSNAFIVLVSSAYDLAMSVTGWLPRLLGVLLLALCFWPLAKLARWVARRATNSPRIDPNLTQLAIAIAFYGVWGLGLLAMLSAVGIDSAGIAAAVGASGFILGFAFQDVLSHFFAGMMLLMGRQFYIGGQIQVGEHEGFVERIDLRALYLRTYDNRQVTIPNGQVFNSAVVVNTSNPTRRREFTVGIGYTQNAREAMEIAVAQMSEVEGVLETPAPEVIVSQLGASSVDLRMFFHTATTNERWLQVQSECILRVKEAFDAAEIEIPFSTQTLDIRGAGELKDAFAPLFQDAVRAENSNGAPALTTRKSGE